MRTLSSRVRELRAAIDEAALTRELADLPAPRVRSLDPAGCAALDDRLRDDLAAAGWDTALDRFRVSGVHGWGPSGTYADVLSDVDLDGVNVVATREGEISDAVLVLAHHDTVPGTGGADDNGSGVVGLLALARLLGEGRFRRTVVLALVDLEELGFHGARRLVQQVTADRAVTGAYVFEMLGYASEEPGSQRLIPGLGVLYPRQVRRIKANESRGDFSAVLFKRSSRTMAALFAAAMRDLTGSGAGAVMLRAPIDLPVIGPLLGRFLPFARNFARSDHLPFWDAGLPAVQITDTADFRNPHYHRETDVPATITMSLVADVVAATAYAVEQLAELLPDGRD